MAKDTITLALGGEVNLSHFATAVSNLEGLVQSLGKVESVGKVQWIVSDLQVGSAIATVHGVGILKEVERIVNAYEDVGQCYHEGRRPSQYSSSVVKHADAIVGIIGEKVTSVRFETPDKDFTVGALPTMASEITKSFGAIEGRVQTLSNRKGLRFVLFDTLHDRAVSCYLSEGQEEKMREMWGKRAIVEGVISRELESGRPLAIRHIADVKVLIEPSKGSYLRARGIVPRGPRVPLAEDIIRQLRDA